MTGDSPDDWQLPTLAFLKEEPLMFGIPRKQAAVVAVAGFFVFMLVSKTVGIIVAVPTTMITVGLLLAVARWQYARDPHWWAHATHHHWPLVRYTGD
ncbi:MAG: hypothetical protein IPK66_18935 [Rhodospirillales bacterium]|nr:hypothetical protein [Rhodospirillales bacterium]